jgi:hypothetical protein
MYVGYVFLCDDPTLKECLERKLFSCSADPGVAQDIGEDSVVFFLNEDSGSLLGPFTAVGSGETRFEPGTWVEKVDEQDLSSNIRVEWEQLHELKMANVKLPFLKNKKVCKLTNVETQNLLNELKNAPLFGEK